MKIKNAYYQNEKANYIKMCRIIEKADFYLFILLMITSIIFNMIHIIFNSLMKILNFSKFCLNKNWDLIKKIF